jgi:hypothetical protein
MNDTSEQDRHARRFLLGQLEEHERQQFEQRLMANVEYQERMLLAEETLIEDYLAGTLPAEQRKQFESKFLVSNPQRRRVRVVRLLANYGTHKVSTLDQPQPVAPSKPRRWTLGFSNHTVVFTCLIAASLLIIGLAVSYIIQSHRETIRRSGIERELAQLNSTPNISASTFPVVLAPVTLRDTNESSTLPFPVPAEIVEVLLVIRQDVTSSYTAVLSKSGTDETFTVASLQVQSTANGQAVVVRLPSRLLDRGDYRVSLIGVANDGRRTVVGDYRFEVGS